MAAGLAAAALGDSPWIELRVPEQRVPSSNQDAAGRQMFDRLNPGRTSGGVQVHRPGSGQDGRRERVGFARRRPAGLPS
jgi:hypothetical protein